MEETTTTTSRRKRNTIVNWKSLVGVVIVLASIGVAGFYYNKAQNSENKITESITNETDATKARNQEETKRITAELGSILLISGDAEPTVARVEDPAVLQKSNPDFYKDTQIGDYLVLYPQRAVVYRSSNKQIINIAPIINTEQLNQKTDAQPTQPAAADSSGQNN